MSKLERKIPQWAQRQTAHTTATTLDHLLLCSVHRLSSLCPSLATVMYCKKDARRKQKAKAIIKEASTRKIIMKAGGDHITETERINCQPEWPQIQHTNTHADPLPFLTSKYSSWNSSFWLWCKSSLRRHRDHRLSALDYRSFLRAQESCPLHRA